MTDIGTYILGQIIIVAIVGLTAIVLYHNITKNRDRKETAITDIYVGLAEKLQEKLKIENIRYPSAEELIEDKMLEPITEDDGTVKVKVN